MILPVSTCFRLCALLVGEAIQLSKDDQTRRTIDSLFEASAQNALSVRIIISKSIIAVDLKTML